MSQRRRLGSDATRLPTHPLNKEPTRAAGVQPAARDEPASSKRRPLSFGARLCSAARVGSKPRAEPTGWRDPAPARRVIRRADVHDERHAGRHARRRAVSEQEGPHAHAACYWRDRRAGVAPRGRRQLKARRGPARHGACSGGRAGGMPRRCCTSPRTAHKVRWPAARALARADARPAAQQSITESGPRRLVASGCGARGPGRGPRASRPVTRPAGTAAAKGRLWWQAARRGPRAVRSAPFGRCAR